MGNVAGTVEICRCFPQLNAGETAGHNSYQTQIVFTNLCSHYCFIKLKSLAGDESQICVRFLRMHFLYFNFFIVSFEIDSFVVVFESTTLSCRMFLQSRSCLRLSSRIGAQSRFEIIVWLLLISKTSRTSILYILLIIFFITCQRPLYLRGLVRWQSFTPNSFYIMT